MKAKFASNYRSETGTPVFRYVVSGTEKELKEFEDAAGEYFRTDKETGQPLWFSIRYVGEDVSLSITENSKIVADDSEIVKIKSLIDQYGVEAAKLFLAAQKG